LTVKYTPLKDGTLVHFDRADGLEAIRTLRSHGFKYGNGPCGRGLYSPTWDRQLGYWDGDRFYLNPSLLHWLELPPIGAA
jgi:hypothetical protein